MRTTPQRSRPIRSTCASTTRTRRPRSASPHCPPLPDEPSVTNLLHARCERTLDPMGEADVRHHLSEVSGWHVVEGAIEKTFAFRHYHETIAFVNALAWIAHTEDH